MQRNSGVFDDLDLFANANDYNQPKLMEWAEIEKLLETAGTGNKNISSNEDAGSIPITQQSIMQQLEQLQAQYSNLENEKQILQQKNQSLEAENLRLDADVKKLTSQQQAFLNVITEQNRNSAAEKEKHENAVRKIQAEKETLENTLMQVEKEKEKETMRLEFSDLKEKQETELKQLNQIFESYKEKTEAAIAIFREEKLSLRMELDALKAELTAKKRPQTVNLIFRHPIPEQPVANSNNVPEPRLTDPTEIDAVSLLSNGFFQRSNALNSNKRLKTISSDESLMSSGHSQSSRDFVPYNNNDGESDFDNEYTDRLASDCSGFTSEQSEGYSSFSESKSESDRDDDVDYRPSQRRRS